MVSVFKLVKHVTEISKQNIGLAEEKKFGAKIICGRGTPVILSSQLISRSFDLIRFPRSDFLDKILQD